MSKSGKSILRGAQQARAYAEGERKGFVAHVPGDADGRRLSLKHPVLTPKGRTGDLLDDPAGDLETS